MSVIAELRDSLDAIGLEQQAFLFSFLTSYPLAIGDLFELRGKRWARVAALVSGAGFAAFTDPWIHGVLLAVMLVVGMGLFIVMVYLIDALPLAVMRLKSPAPTPLQAIMPVQVAEGEVVPEVLRGREGRPPRLSLPGPAGTH